MTSAWFGHLRGIVGLVRGTAGRVSGRDGQLGERIGQPGARIGQSGAQIDRAGECVGPMGGTESLVSGTRGEAGGGRGLSSGPAGLPGAIDGRFGGAHKRKGGEGSATNSSPAEHSRQAHSARIAAGFVQNKPCGSTVGASFEGDLVVSHFREELVLAFGEQFKLWQTGQIPGRELCDTLGEKAIAVARDFENQVRCRLITPGVVIEGLRINMNLSPLFWRLGIGERRLRVQEMNPDIIHPSRCKSI